MLLRKQLQRLIEHMPDKLLKYAAEAIRTILEGFIYEPNVRLVPVYDMSNPEHMKRLIEHSKERRLYKLLIKER